MRGQLHDLIRRDPGWHVEQQQYGSSDTEQLLIQYGMGRRRWYRYDHLFSIDGLPCHVYSDREYTTIGYLWYYEPVYQLNDHII